MSCDAICCMSKPYDIERGRSGWLLDSNGARLEAHYAKTVGLPFMLAHVVTEYDRKVKGNRTEWIIEIPRCWPGMFGEARNKTNGH